MYLLVIDNNDLSKKPDYSNMKSHGNVKSCTVDKDSYVFIYSRHMEGLVYIKVYVDDKFIFSKYLYSNGIISDYSPSILVSKNSKISFEIESEETITMYENGIVVIPII